MYITYITASGSLAVSATVASALTSLTPTIAATTSATVNNSNIAPANIVLQQPNTTAAQVVSGPIGVAANTTPTLATITNSSNAISTVAAVSNTNAILMQWRFHNHPQ
ncbi:uncharacterized protein LOC142230735 [Haematobia irritans]|uniref:uncharacterized protein LOC142227104 n=1 Tax=Haematobia irritans TaxID=7368 RepID=UPI003F50B7F8